MSEKSISTITIEISEIYDKITCPLPKTLKNILLVQVTLNIVQVTLNNI